jgi:hypothetical protein
VRENKIVLVSLSEGLQEMGEIKCQRMKEIETTRLYMKMTTHCTVSCGVLGELGDRERGSNGRERG